MLNRRIFIGASLTAWFGLLTACSSGGDQPQLTVGSKEFTEQYILGNMYEIALDNAGFDAEYKVLASSNENHEALLNGEIDLYPEYTGTALLSIFNLEFDPGQTADQVYDTVEEAYNAEGLAILEPTSFNNTYALMMTQERADELDVKTVSDLSTKAGELKLGTDREFPTRADGLVGLQEVYGGFNFDDVVVLDAGLLYAGLEENEIDVTTGYGTDGQIDAFDLVVLEDDKGFWPPYPVVPVVRQEVLDEHPEIADVLNPIAALLDSETMQQLNWEVAGNSREPDEVAREFLETNGLL
ncbi:glycine/betaine ABC transporter [Romeria aff. gracilis LEGE 07310]|uniref:Glycine/betaine ABC transporter n=1 Tax=Vasconcelosia minhoensis LEGE 07310 TaxID=915328 RepID=A0A8J7DNY5_9CYAN|nr:glycine betaine ABC transporter substrate-binding protein [Romeria gracilis]MBE9078800.1 glycine/betaine ABC transporter [Romeria aff. gracilis LEGE 07310]